MEAEPLILPDNTVIDPTQPPPNFPRPDFTEIVQTHPTDSPEKVEGAILKPTFKSVLQAKKRLQAFSSNRTGSLPNSPKKVKPSEEKNEENATPVKKTSKKGNSHDDKAKAVIEEIEELKREEKAHIQSLKRSRTRSRSRSPDWGRFKKVEKKSRNYRRRSKSLTPEKPRKSPKKAKKYPKNWREFFETEATFDLNRVFEVTPATGNNELFRQMRFESPSLLIVPSKMKTANREEKIIPFEYIRYTRTKPVITYSVNFGAIKESFLTKKLVWNSLPKEVTSSLDTLYSNSIKLKNEGFNNKVKKSKAWYPKIWKDAENECKILEKSVGLSFLQTYTGEEDENDIVEEEKIEIIEEKIEIREEKIEIVEEEKLPVEEIKEKTVDLTKEETEKPSQEGKKKKKKHKKVEDVTEEPVTVDKKKKKRKDKKKTPEENTTEVSTKKKKRKKEKKKKDKSKKEKKQKHKKSKDKKKEKSHEEQTEEEKSPQKPSKEQIIEELKQVEEQLAKVKGERTEKKEEKEEKSHKHKKHSEREDDAKKVKQEKHKKTSVENDDKIENPLKKKLEKAKKYEMEVKLEVHKRKKEKHEHNDAKKSKVPPVEDHPKKIEDHPKKIEDHPKKIEDHPKKIDEKKEENVPSRRRKSRWSEPEIVKEEQFEYHDEKILEQIRKIEEKIKKEEFQDKEVTVSAEEVKDKTPDTDEYHSLWESEDEIATAVPRQSLKHNRSWESDEELFERTNNRSKIQTDSYENLEIPLNININARRTHWEEKPFSVIDELKLLEEERRSLSEERRKLELEKQKILKMQEEAKIEVKETKVDEEPKEVRSSTPEEVVVVKKEKSDAADFSIDSLNNSLLSTVSSTESSFPVAALENEYEEFIKAVSSESSSTTVTPKKKPEERDSDSSASSSDSDYKKKKRKKKKKKRKKKDCEGLLLGKGNHIFNEFDIPVPSDLPEMVPTPVPVPSPLLPLDSILPLTTPNLLLSTISEISEKPVELPQPEAGIDLSKPFVFSSIVLSSKKTPLVDNSTLKLDDDSDSADFTDKFVKKPEEVKDKEEETEIKTIEIKESPKIEQLDEQKPDPPELVVPKPIDDISEVPLPPDTPKDTPTRETKPPEPIKNQRSHSRSISPNKTVEKHKERRRSRSRSPIRRRRHISPRRRTPPRRSRRSPSPRRRSPYRRRRRSPSITPPRSRKRTPSPRIRRVSPLNSPLDGFKKSVADSTVSDDVLPQPTPEEYSESPPTFGGVADKKLIKRNSLELSPRRIPLDDRINQVLGLEHQKNEPPPSHKPIEQPIYQNYHNSYGQYPQYQYGQQPQPQQKTDFVTPPPTFNSMMFTQPPPPIPKPTKVVQVGNILQVVPSEDIPHPPPSLVVENKPAERSQKIVQVGNMLQIVPAVLPTSKLPIPLPEPPPPPPQPVAKPVPVPEKPSAETLMKQKIAERKAERDKRRQERERRRKEKEKKRKDKEKKRQMKLKIKTENMIKRAIQIETEALANEDIDDEDPDNADQPIQWPPVSAIVAGTSGKGILLAQGGSRKRKSVQFADGVRPGDGTSPSGGEELSSPPPQPRKLPKEKRFKKLKIPKKSKKRKVRVKVVKKRPEEEEDDDDDDNLPPPSPPPGSPPPHVFPSRVKTHTINNVQPSVQHYVGSILQSNPSMMQNNPSMMQNNQMQNINLMQNNPNIMHSNPNMMNNPTIIQTNPMMQNNPNIIQSSPNLMQSNPGGFPFRPPMPVVINRHQPPPGYMPGTPYSSDVNINRLSHPPPPFQGVSTHQ